MEVRSAAQVVRSHDVESMYTVYGFVAPRHSLLSRQHFSQATLDVLSRVI